MIVISMLRGVNLGPHRRMKMDDLRGVYELLGLREIHTFLQSGNVVFRTAERDLDKLAGRIEKGIENRFGFHSDVILRTSSEMKDVIGRNPFASRPDIHPSRLLVWFLAGDPGQKARDKVLTIKADPEELHIHDRELYIYYPNGLARPKLSMATVEKALKTAGTGRNWNSVTKMFELAAKLDTDRS